MSRLPAQKLSAVDVCPTLGVIPNSTVVLLLLLTEESEDIPGQTVREPEMFLISSIYYVVVRIRQACSFGHHVLATFLKKHALELHFLKIFVGA